MARKKKETKEEEEETALVAGSVDDLMAPAEAPSFNPDDAGLGSEDVGASDVVLPRVSLLQGLSKVVAEDLPGAKAGGYWVVPHNRPATFSSRDNLKFVVVRIYPSQRLWTPINEGGGLICEAAAGDLIAREPLGLKDAELVIDHDGGNVKSIEWQGGSPTDNCRKCVFGPAAAAVAAGRKPTGRGNPWLPKYITYEGERIRIPDEMRAPKCTSSLDVLALIALPPFEDDETGVSLAPEIIPAFISFSRSAQAAGRSLAGMIKMAANEPSWAKIFSLGAKSVSNDKGTFYIPTIQQFSFAKPALQAMARELYDSTNKEDFRPNMDDGGDMSSDGATESTADRPPNDDEPAPEDDF